MNELRLDEVGRRLRDMYMTFVEVSIRLSLFDEIGGGGVTGRTTNGPCRRI